MKRLSKDRLFLLLLLPITLCIPIVVLYSTIQERERANAPVDVLKNWTLRVDSTHDYAPGQSVDVVSSFQKVITITGNSTRYIQCVKPEYINEVTVGIQGKADYQVPNSYWDGRVPINVSTGGQPITPKHERGVSNYSLGIPFTITSLPNYCRVYVNIVYNINKYHPTFSESNNSNYFHVIPPVGTSSVPQTVIYTDNPSAFDSKTYTSTDPLPTQKQAPVVIIQTPPNSEEESSEATPTPPPPSLIDRVQNTVSGILNVVGL